MTTYMTRTRRVYNLLARVRYYLAKRLEWSPEPDTRLAAALEWMDEKGEDLRDWYARLRKARRYGARHKRKIFAVDAVSGKLKLERSVTRSTPEDQRDYRADDTQSFRAFLTRKLEDQRTAQDAVYKQLWDEETAGLVRHIQHTRRNADLVMSGAEGPLLP